MVKQKDHPLDPLLDDIESIRKTVISTKADSPQFRSLLRNMIRHVEDIKALEQIPLSTYNAVTSLLSPLLDTENKLLLDRLKTQQLQTVDVLSLEKHVTERKSHWDNANHAIQKLRTSMKRMYVLLNAPPAPECSDEQLCQTTEGSLQDHLSGDSLLRTEIENLIQVTQVSLQTINSILQQTGDDANDMVEIEQILERKLPENPKDAYALLQRTRKALLKTLRKLSDSSSLLHQAMQSQVQSIESLSRRLEEAEDQANRDSLTGLANRRQLGRFMSTLEDITVALLMVDIDRFKSINDRYGHLIGDKILADIASMLTSSIRTTDIAARFGGEEFCIVLPGATHDMALAKATRLKESIANHAFDTEAGQIPITASIGVAVRHKAETIPQWTKRADAALYQAKQSGRDRVISAEKESDD